MPLSFFLFSVEASFFFFWKANMINNVTIHISTVDALDFGQYFVCVCVYVCTMIGRRTTMMRMINKYSKSYMCDVLYPIQVIRITFSYLLVACAPFCILRQIRQLLFCMHCPVAVQYTINIIQNWDEHEEYDDDDFDMNRCEFIYWIHYCCSHAYMPGCVRVGVSRLIPPKNFFCHIFSSFHFRDASILYFIVFEMHHISPQHTQTPVIYGDIFFLTHIRTTMHNQRSSHTCDAFRSRRCRYSPY